ncbi:class III extradiol ring-cleavage dioxygenase [Bacillus sp. FJAT-47783]|uniref:DODA-type extradiol aromatic ring-opening family dioxygenase n=1 Tax=Bacillus sp. FJAT-47783 TaxID=2922712 RepID=UPI001FACC8DA|nr:class III extradiol ring-cleavage dioxygenase [Bacillus sp. FJAT-47783]
MVPSLFLAHGSPMIAVQDNLYTRFLTKLGSSFQPKAIVLFTAHWESEVLTISSRDDIYETIHDFYGFPDELFEVQYPAKGSSEVAKIVQSRLEQSGIKTKLDTTRGLDHGSWTILKHLYPEANIPIVPVSVNPFLTAGEQFQIGKALKGLGEEDILVIGSGATIHNLRDLKWGQTSPERWSVEFDDWLIQHIVEKNEEKLTQYEELAPHVKRAVPRPEHFVPLFIAMGSGALETPVAIFREYEMGTLSYLSFQF